MKQTPLSHSVLFHGSFVITIFRSGCVALAIPAATALGEAVACYQLNKKLALIAGQLAYFSAIMPTIVEGISSTVAMIRSAVALASLRAFFCFLMRPQHLVCRRRLDCNCSRIENEMERGQRQAISCARSSCAFLCHRSGKRHEP